MMHPTIVAHNVFPAIFIPLSYLVAYLILSTFFTRQREHADYALFFLAALTIFGNVFIHIIKFLVISNMARQGDVS